MVIVIPAYNIPHPCALEWYLQQTMPLDPGGGQSMQHCMYSMWELADFGSR